MSAVTQPNYRSRYATSLTRTGKIDMTNRKPYRTEYQKELARDMAETVKGTFVSSAPVTTHRTPTSREF